MQYEHTYNALYVVLIKVRVSVNPYFAYNNDYTALWAHYNAL